MLYEWAASTPVGQTAYELTLSAPTVLFWFDKFREIAARFVVSRVDGAIGVAGDTVEVDESQIGRRKYHRGRRPNEVWVFGGIVRGSNPCRLFLEIVPNRRATTLIPIIQRRINSNARVITDCWGSYNGLAALGVNHATVNHSEGFLAAGDPEIHTQGIENLWRCLRRFLNARTSYSRDHLDSYLKEFVFRKSFIDPFETMLSAIQYFFRFD